MPGGRLNCLVKARCIYGTNLNVDGVIFPSVITLCINTCIQNNVRATFFRLIRLLLCWMIRIKGFTAFKLHTISCAEPLSSSNLSLLYAAWVKFCQKSYSETELIWTKTAFLPCVTSIHFNLNVSESTPAGLRRWPHALSVQCDASDQLWRIVSLIEAEQWGEWRSGLGRDRKRLEMFVFRFYCKDKWKQIADNVSGYYKRSEFWFVQFLPAI